MFTFFINVEQEVDPLHYCFKPVIYLTGKIVNNNTRL